VDRDGDALGGPAGRRVHEREAVNGIDQREQPLESLPIVPHPKCPEPEIGPVE
jgi:hypothetical protein